LDLLIFWRNLIKGMRTMTITHNNSRSSKQEAGATWRRRRTRGREAEEFLGCWVLKGNKNCCCSSSHLNHPH
jgi:hypothetical protein